MTSSDQLTFAFLESHPSDAARVLERLAPAPAAALLRSVPLRLAVPVLRHMLPLAGARCLELMDDAEAAGMLHGMGVQPGVALMRHLVAGQRTRLLKQLPTAITIAYELLLGYPEGTVGAWMDPHALALPADMTCGEALERVRSASEEHVADPFVVGRNQRLQGYVELAHLLRAQASTPLGNLLRSITHRLPTQAMLAGLRDHPGWRESSVLPVVDSDGRLVGAISHAAMQQGLSKEQASPARPGTRDTLVELAAAYWFGVSSLIQSLVSMLPVERGEEET